MGKKLLAANSTDTMFAEFLLHWMFNCKQRSCWNLLKAKQASQSNMNNALFNLTYEASDILNVNLASGVSWPITIKALKQQELLLANQSWAKPKESVTQRLQQQECTQCWFDALQTQFLAHSYKNRYLNFLIRINTKWYIKESKNFTVESGFKKISPGA